MKNNHDAPPSELCLTVGNGAAPFELSRSEKDDLGPEDWAWLLLRLNRQYRDDYENARAEHEKQRRTDEKVKPNAVDHPHRKVTFAETLCREKYGLSSWLDPAEVRLPALEAFESWFAPLRSVGVDLPSNSAMINFAATESIFGIQQWFDDHTSDVVKYTGNTDTAGVWFVIDCSIPVTGQFESVKLLSKMYSQQLRAWGFTKSDFKLKSGDTLITSTYIFDPRRSKSMSSIFPKSPSPRALLSENGEARINASMAVHIDLFGNSVAQINKSEMLLRAQHHQLTKDNIAKPSTVDRFWLRLASNRGRGVGSPTDGHRLKAYALLSEFDLCGLSNASAIVAELLNRGMDSKSALSQMPDEWLDFTSSKSRSLRFEKYLDEAREFSVEDCKWLVNSQIPPRLNV